MYISATFIRRNHGRRKRKRTEDVHDNGYTVGVRKKHLGAGIIVNTFIHHALSKIYKLVCYLLVYIQIYVTLEFCFSNLFFKID